MPQIEISTSDSQLWKLIEADSLEDLKRKGFLYFNSYLK